MLISQSNVLFYHHLSISNVLTELFVQLSILANTKSQNIEDNKDRDYKFA